MNSFVDLHPDDDQWDHHYFTVEEDERLHYIRSGEGKPVLLLHGWPGFWYDYRRVIPILSKEADVIAPDYLGFGFSDKPAKPPAEAYSPEAQTKRIIRLVEEFNLEEVIVVGYDIGGRMAQFLVQQIPNRISGLVLCNPPYPGIGNRRFSADAQREFWYQHFHITPNGPKIVGLNRETVKLYLEHFYDHWLGKKEALRPKEFEAIADVYARTNAFERSVTWYQAGAGTGLGKPLEGSDYPEPTVMECPTIILWGEKDPIFPKAWTDRLGDYFPNHELHFLKDIGHFGPFEAPEEIIESIRKLR